MKTGNGPNSKKIIEKMSEEIRLFRCCTQDYPVGTLQVHMELPLAQFQEFLIALMPPIPV
jgi:hypothetical protein